MAGTDDGVRQQPREESWFARSWQDARPGELVLLDEQGSVVRPRRSTVKSIAICGAVGLAIGVVSFVAEAVLGVGSLHWIAIGGYVAYVYWNAWRWKPILAAQRQLAAGRTAEAAELLAPLLERPRPGTRTYLDLVCAQLAWMQGRLEESLAGYRHVLARMRRSRRYQRNPIYWATAADHCALLVIAGRVEEARAVRQQLARAPASELFDARRTYIDLLLAFHAGDRSALDGTDLYDKAKQALRTNLEGSTVVLLAWAFADQGAPEMARHMLREAPARLVTSCLAATDPALCTWLRETWTAWDLEREEGELVVP